MAWSGTDLKMAKLLSFKLYVSIDESPIPLPQAPITPPTVLPPSPVLSLSPLFDPQDFFLPEEIMPPHKRAYFLSLSSTDLSAQPQAFEIGENYHDALDTSYTRHEEQTELQEARTQISGLQRKKMIHKDKIALARFKISTLELIIEDIQVRRQSDIFLKPLYPDIMDMINDQDIEHTISPTLSLDYPLISYLSGRGMKPLGSEPVPEKPNIMPPKRTSTSAAPPLTQAAIKKLVADSVFTALEAQAATIANTDNTNRNTRPREAPVATKSL
nr:hypothetical protein [Tanacetum cinerariifolium]